MWGTESLCLEHLNFLYTYRYSLPLLVTCIRIRSVVPSWVAGTSLAVAVVPYTVVATFAVAASFVAAASFAAGASWVAVACTLRIAVAVVAAGVADSYFVGVVAADSRLLLGGFPCPGFVARQECLGMSCRLHLAGCSCVRPRGCRPFDSASWHSDCGSGAYADSFGCCVTWRCRCHTCDSNSNSRSA